MVDAGVFLLTEGLSVRVFAPESTDCDLVVFEGLEQKKILPLAKSDGFFTGEFPDHASGTLYKFRLDGQGPFPDPWSHFQPYGVHGPSQAVDHGRFAWTDHDWRGLPMEKAVIYELHVGTFTSEGTFAALSEKLEYFRDLGVTVLELLPVADFPGEFNWGYDGVNQFAPARCYGRPDDLKALIDRAHSFGMAVILDVVYNHFGADGNYLGLYLPQYVAGDRGTPWGPALNFDGPGSKPVREFFVQNAIHWLEHYHFDGFRFDALHAIHDHSREHILAEIARVCRERLTGRQLIMIAEDHSNDRLVIEPQEKGLAMDGVWSDDFHHQARVLSCGDQDWYYSDFSGCVADLAATIRQGWFFTGQYSQYFGRSRGTSCDDLPRHRLVSFIQNHDQVGNRPFGDRIHHRCGQDLYRALSALLMLSPYTPLIFSGQEWAAGAPFLFFADHKPEIAPMVTEGRRKMFEQHRKLLDGKDLEHIPDPCAQKTFLASKLDWAEPAKEPHKEILRLYRDLIALRKTGLFPVGPEEYSVCDEGESGLVLDYRGRKQILFNLGEGKQEVRIKGSGWNTVFSTFNKDYGASPDDCHFLQEASGFLVRMEKSGAVMLAGG
ncbi:MAG: malto-oligosyltrehalose trehalohydrolase [Candidatus Wallbacteria bacterium]|nr:malto-oligosyltrehalose trehalohydrolase [Candidatus Wallbacteria bacterium]